MNIKQSAHVVQKLLEAPEPEEIVIPSNKLRNWAAKNCYTLIFLSLMFIITWVIILFDHNLG